MIDIEKQVSYWVNSASEDWDVAKDLVSHSLLPQPSLENAQEYIQKAEGLITWLKEQLLR